jgi:hypothetical protein
LKVIRYVVLWIQASISADKERPCETFLIIHSWFYRDAKVKEGLALVGQCGVVSTIIPVAHVGRLGTRGGSTFFADYQTRSKTFVPIDFGICRDASGHERLASVSQVGVDGTQTRRAF